MGGSDFVFGSPHVLSILILSSPFSTSRVYFGEKSTSHTILTFTIFFTFRYYWFQKPIPTYDSVILGQHCLFRSFSDLTHKILSAGERCAPFFVCFTSYLSWLKALILPQVSKRFSPPSFFFVPFFLLSFFLPFLFSSFLSSTALPASDSWNLD